MSSEDQRSQFLVMLGVCAEGARLAHTRIAVQLEDGSEVDGVPTSSPLDGSEQQLDHTGTGRVLHLDGIPVDVMDVRSYRVTRPT